MRSTLKCTKCSGQKFVVTDEFCIPYRDKCEIEPFPAFVGQVKRGWAWHTVTQGAFSTWVCLGCGYTEFYVCRPEGLETIAKGFPDRMRIIDAAAQEQGPFR